LSSGLAKIFVCDFPFGVFVSFSSYIYGMVFRRWGFLHTLLIMRGLCRGFETSKVGTPCVKNTWFTGKIQTFCVLPTSENACGVDAAEVNTSARGASNHNH
jgi:hypothetical protein